jgi:membrane-associated phospholipid phosphatase
VSDIGRLAAEDWTQETRDDLGCALDRVESATRRTGVISARLASWLVVDWAVAAYAIFVALLAVICAIPEWPNILLAHGALIGALVLLPPRGAAWERVHPEDRRWLTHVRAIARFLRYTYPALLLTPFFEEVSVTVNAVSPGVPYWFERYLYAADQALFGDVPAVLLSQAGWPGLDEVMHAFYFSYYPLLIGGIAIAWSGGKGARNTPARGFHTTMTCLMLGFFLSYVWYPFLPARGPWESPEVMAGLRPFGGWVFTGAIDLIIAAGAVSGGCFPSAHASGTWALVFALYPRHRRAALWFGLVALGLSVACVYTRYHHAVDVLAGLAVAAVAVAVGRWLTRTS